MVERRPKTNVTAQRTKEGGAAEPLRPASLSACGPPPLSGEAPTGSPERGAGWPQARLRGLAPLKGELAREA